MQITPVASASPNGDFRVIRDFRWIPQHELDRIARIERAHMERLIDRAEDFEEAEFRWQNQVQRLRNAADAGREPGEVFVRKLSSRQAVIVEADEVRWISYSIGEAVRNERSRSHRLKKSKLRLERRGR